MDYVNEGLKNSLLNKIHELKCIKNTGILFTFSEIYD